MAALAADLDAALADIAQALKVERACARLPPLRADHAAVTAAEGAADLVAQETDRMVDGVDTLGHVLGDGDRIDRDGAA